MLKYFYFILLLDSSIIRNLCYLYWKFIPTLKLKLQSIIIQTHKNARKADLMYIKLYIA